MASVFFTPQHFIERRVHVVLLGAGGTGSEVLDALARVHVALLKLGHPGGLHVTVIDGDRVSASNVGRQRFAECDIGHYKSLLLTHRYNLFFGLDWQAVPGYWTPSPENIRALRDADLIVTCVDRADVRVALARAGQDLSPGTLWLDFGNGAHQAQCVLGHLVRSEEDGALYLPNVYDLFPELTTVEDAREPSCSFAESEHRQNLFINRTVADAGLALLWELFRRGSLRRHGAFVDLEAGTVSPLMIDPTAWAFLGYRKGSGDARRIAAERAS